MPIDSKHPIYTRNFPRWQECRDVYNGEDAVKARGDHYLPQPGGLTGGEYDAYRKRALFYEAVGRTVDGFVGAISRKDPNVVVPAGLDDVVKDVTTDGLSLAEFAKMLCGETILMGRGGLLVDYDEKLNRAYLAFYPAEAITNWSADGVVLFETVYEKDPDDSFNQVAVEQYREITLLEGVYTVQLWRKAKKTNIEAPEWERYGEPILPSRRGKPLDKLPFYWLSPQGRSSRAEKPPLLGLVKVCISHYRNSADLEHGRHFTGLPTLYVTGIAAQDAPIRVGAMSAITITDPQAKVGYAEFTGQGLASLEKALEQKEAMMATLGAALISDGPKGVEAAETARIRTSGETSLLSGVVVAVEESLQDALACCAEWMSVSGTTEITLNRDFIPDVIDGRLLTGLVQAFQSGALSLRQFLFNLQQGDMLAPNTDLDDEAKIVEAAIEKLNAQALKVKTAPNTSANRPAGGANTDD